MEGRNLWAMGRDNILVTKPLKHGDSMRPNNVETARAGILTVSSFKAI